MPPQEDVWKWESWQVAHVTEAFMHVLKDFPLASAVSCNVRLISVSTGLCNQSTLLTCHHVAYDCSPYSKKQWKGSMRQQSPISKQNTLSAGDSKRLPEIYTIVAEYWNKCASDMSTLKEIDGKTGIHSSNFLIELCSFFEWNEWIIPSQIHIFT